MLLLAGLLGLAAVGSVALAVDFSDDGTKADADIDAANDTEVLKDTEARAIHPAIPRAIGPEPDPIFDPNSDPNSDPISGPPAAVEPGVVLPGADGPDILAGGGGDDQINGYDGDDHIAGGAGDDDLHGAAGDDSIQGEDGDDTLHGQAGADRLRGGDGDDTLFGHDGDDVLSGAAGSDELVGGMGDDTLIGGSGDDALSGNHGDDTLIGGAGHDTIFGGAGNDRIDGVERADGAEQAADFLNGGDGDDTIIAGANDMVSGGDGADTVVIEEPAGKDMAPVTWTDFEEESDRLALACDLTGAEPLVDIVPDESDPELAHILLDGIEVAAVYGPTQITRADIDLIDAAQAGHFA